MQKAACLFARGEGRKEGSAAVVTLVSHARTRMKRERSHRRSHPRKRQLGRTIKKRAKDRQPANVERQVLAVVLYINTMPSLYISAKRYYCHGAWSVDVWTKLYSVG